MELTGIVPRLGVTTPLGRALKPLPDPREGAALSGTRPAQGQGSVAPSPNRGAERLGYALSTPQRTFQAVSAYTDVERSQDREYLSEVFGVDEYA